MSPPGQVIVSKVFVGQSVPLVVGSPLDQNHYPNAYSVHQNVENRCRSGGCEGMQCLKMHEGTNVWYLSNVIIHVSFRGNLLFYNRHCP